MKKTDYLEAFADYLIEEEKSIGTVSGYKLEVKDFIYFFNKDIKGVKRTDVTAYKEHLRDRKLKTVSINRKLVSIRQFIDFVNDRFELGFCTTSPLL
jgi:integrase/recombinase XerD